jgi:hypothetical protein
VAELKTTVCFCAGDKSCDKICSNCLIQALTLFVSFKSFNGLVLAIARNSAALIFFDRRSIMLSIS